MSVTAPSMRAAAVMALIGALMSCGFSAGRMLASGLQLAAPALQRVDGGARRSYTLPRWGGRISVKIPADWQFKYSRPAVQPFPTIAFRPPPASQDFQVLLSPLLPAARSIGRLRHLVESMPEAVKAESVEPEFPLWPLKGRSGKGFYFSATAHTPQAGKYKHLTQGAIKAGRLIVAFSILTNEGQEEVVQQALGMMRSVRHQIDRARASTWNEAIQIDPEWALVIALPGFQGLPDARHLTAPTQPLPLTAGLKGPEPEEVADRFAPAPLSFRLVKLGHVLRIRWVRKEQGQTQAIAAAIQLAGTRGKKQFALNLIVDGKRPKTRQYKAGNPIDLEARGARLPYQIRVTEVSGQSISGEIAPSSPAGNVEFDFYTADGHWIEKSPRMQWRPHPFEGDPNSARDSASTSNVVSMTGSGGNNPVPLRQTNPSYTDAAIVGKIQGTVLLQAVVREDGSVDDIQIIKSLGYSGLDEATIEEIANQWAFRPGTLNGKPVAVRVTIEVTFSLR